MHGSPPAGAILIHSMGPDAHPDFSGPGFLAAKKAMLMGDEAGDPVGSGEPIPHPEGMCDALMAVASDLREQADKIEELCAQLMGEAPPKKGGEEPSEESHGEATELE